MGPAWPSWETSKVMELHVQQQGVTSRLQKLDSLNDVSDSACDAGHVLQVTTSCRACSVVLAVQQHGLPLLVAMMLERSFSLPGCLTPYDWFLVTLYFSLVLHWCRMPPYWPRRRICARVGISSVVEEHGVGIGSEDSNNQDRQQQGPVIRWHGLL
jgi:hypothetical protein